MNSTLFNLDLNDFTKGALLAVVVAVLTLVVELLQAKGFNFTAVDFQIILQVAVTAFIAYLAKNFSTNSKGELGKAE